jgi:hypothetical protein
MILNLTNLYTVFDYLPSSIRFFSEKTVYTTGTTTNLDAVNHKFLQNVASPYLIYNTAYLFLYMLLILIVFLGYRLKYPKNPQDYKPTLTSLLIVYFTLTVQALLYNSCIQVAMFLNSDTAKENEAE